MLKRWFASLGRTRGRRRRAGSFDAGSPMLALAGLGGSVAPATAGPPTGVDRTLIAVVAALVMIGTVMVYSASISLADSPRFNVAPTQSVPVVRWNPDEKRADDFRAGWQEVPDTEPYPNGFRRQWEMFIRHVVADAPWPHTLLEGAKGVQLAELALESWKSRAWVDVPPLSLTGEKSRARKAAHVV